ncbi:hypothetical protein CgunFtcFv8_013027 [Champsocephalus gunnari]|uniref:Protein phosphatase 1 regulatory subunit 32 n=1 Tax=Champsocephalus gunnari TaxID=52237 RepID=A0AAN8HTA2_CHAGU|nr:hypothetical protein CgunFtcFv8_013027 [Champsocephalus gunnari]
MAAQGRMVMPTGSRGRPTRNKLQNTSYVPGTANFSSYLRHPRETGYTSNQRPVVFYRPSLDHIDNPQFGLLLSDSFTTQTKQHYQPHVRSDCWGSLPNLINKPRDSGFYQLRIHPKAETVEEKTEYQQCFLPHCQTPKVSQNRVTVAPRGESGFTEGTNLQLNTFQDKTCMVEPLQTHTVMTNDFIRPSFPQGTEARPSVCSSHFSHKTGFNRVAIPPLTCRASRLPSPQTKSNAPTAKTIGKKEPTGCILNAPNNQALPTIPFDGSHFNTHYKSTFCHDANWEKFKSGHTSAGIVSAKMDNGYNRRDTDRYINNLHT